MSRANNAEQKNYSTKYNMVSITLKLFKYNFVLR